MIISKYVNVKISKSTIKFYKNKNYNVKLKEFSKIKICDLPKNSHIKVKVKCDICNNEKEITYQRYNLNIENGGYYSYSQKCSIEKVKKTNIERYGLSSVL
jgi:hypothetical protein